MTESGTAPLSNPASAPAWEPAALWSRPAGQRDGTPLLVMFHGYMADEEDLMGLADHLPAEFTVVSVRAPHAESQGYSWFPLSRESDYSVAAVVEALTPLAAWIDSIRGAHSSVSLLGFSMGMGVATSLLRHRPSDFTCAVGLSGFAVPPEGHPFFNDDELAARKVPFFWGRDQEDQVIAPSMVEYTHGWLTAHTRLTKVLYPNMWHSISQQELAHVREFLTLTVLDAPQGGARRP